MTCAGTMDPSNNLAKTFQSNSKMIEYEPSLMRSCAKGNQLMGGKSTTNTTISKSLKLSIAKELFASSKMSRAASKGQVPKMTTQNASVSNDATSRKTNQLYPSSSRASLSAALNRSASKLSRKTQDDSLEGGDDYESRLSEPASLRSTTSHSCLQSRRSCLKKDGDKSTRRSVNRSASADQLSFQVRLPGNRKPVVRTRSITFDESVRVRRVTSISELSKGRSNELWFNTEEYNVIKRKTFNLIRAVQNGDTAGVNYCTRGLEKYFDAQKVQHTRAAAWESVLSAQEGQRRNGSYDDLQLSQAYSAVSSQCMEEACKRGQLDHESIERYLHKTKKIMRTQSLPSAAMIAAASHKSQS